MTDFPVRVLNVFMELDRGGAETLVMNLYRKIDCSKIQFDFFVHGDKIGAYENEIKTLGGRIYHLPNYSLRNIFEYNRAIKAFFQEHKEYHIVHAHNSELGNLILRQAKIAGIPHRICHAHSVPQGISFRNIIRNIFKWHTDLYTTERFACSKAAGIWQFGKHSDFTVINNGIDTDIFKFDESKRKYIRDKYSLDGKYVIGHIGRFSYPKNHEFLIKVFKEVLSKRPEAMLMCVGDGVLRPKMETLSKSLGISEHVIFAGVQEDVSAFLDAFDVFAFPSLFEGLPVTLIEAQATGLHCIISSNVPKEVALTDNCEFISLNDTKHWIDKIAEKQCYLRENNGLILLSKGYDINFSAESISKYYLELGKI